jgi:hypothetical protein
VIQEWAAHLEGAKGLEQASDLYAGRGFLEAKKAVGFDTSRLWIISAGLGLINGGQWVPPYDLTLAPNSKNSVQNKIGKGVKKKVEWWQALEGEFSFSRALKEIVEDKPEAIFVMALSESYFSMLLDSIESLSGSACERLRIITSSSISLEGNKFGEVIIPYNEKLDGPDSESKGTKADFYQRAARHFIDSILVENPAGSGVQHKKQVASLMEGMRSPQRPTREKLPDEQVISLIEKNWEMVGGRSAEMLRYLRDKEQIACEQGRFARLFKHVKEEKAQKNE